MEKKRKQNQQVSISYSYSLIVCAVRTQITRDLLSKKTKILCLNMTEQIAKPVLAHLKLLQEIQKKFLDEQL